MSEPRASLTRSYFAGSASLFPWLAFCRTPWLRPRYGHRVPASRAEAFHLNSSCAAISRAFPRCCSTALVLPAHTPAHAVARCSCSCVTLVPARRRCLPLLAPASQHLLTLPPVHCRLRPHLPHLLARPSAQLWRHAEPRCTAHVCRVLRPSACTPAACSARAPASAPHGRTALELAPPSAAFAPPARAWPGAALASRLRSRGPLAARAPALASASACAPRPAAGPEPPEPARLLHARRPCASRAAASAWGRCRSLGPPSARGCAAGGKKKKGSRKAKAEKEKWDSSKDLCANLENCRDLFVKQNFPSIQNPNEEMPKMKVGEFFKLYNIALGLKFKNSKFIFLHVNF
jgi:hypothetical protein